jgi:hypothetical protein
MRSGNIHLYSAGRLDLSAKPLRKDIMKKREGKMLGECVLNSLTIAEPATPI